MVYASILVNPEGSVHVQVGQDKSMKIRRSIVDSTLDFSSLSLQSVLTLSSFACDTSSAPFKPTPRAILTEQSIVLLKHLSHSRSAPLRVLP